MVNMIRIKASFLGEKKIIKVNSNDSISTIIQKINSDVINGLPLTDIEIINKYSFNLQTRPLIVDPHNLSQELKNIVKSKRFELKIVKNICGGTSNTFPSWVKTFQKPCIKFGDTHTCVKLGCGCFISFEGLRKYVEKQMRDNDVLLCDICNKLLEPVDDIIQYCSFDGDKEDKYYDTFTKRHRIYVKSNGQIGDLGDAECPHCQTMNRRATLIKYKMQCMNCSKSFCYECEETWKKSGTVVCGNKDCLTMEIQKDLLECEPLQQDKNRGWVKYFNDKFNLTGKNKIPAFRACPRCWNISTVADNCRHITCQECKYYYCFACLKPMQGHSDDVCKVNKPAPRQVLN